MFYFESDLGLYSVDVDNVHGESEDIVTSLVYDAKGQRQKIQHGNGTTAKYTYDPNTFRVTRIRTTRHIDSVELQDLRYWYDPVGNVTLLKDLAQQDVYFDNTVVSADNDNTYDALYRLIKAKGRELIGNDGAADWNDSSRSGKDAIPFMNTVSSSDTNALRRYKDEYSYDAVGNTLEIYHKVGDSGNRKRTFVIDGGSNRLTSSTTGTNTPVTENYTYDNRGNLVGGMSHLDGMVYNAENRLEKVTHLNTDIVTYYQYDSSGQRVRKTTINSDADITEMRKYVGGWEVFEKRDDNDDILLSRETLHVSDDTGRIVLIETQTDITPEPVLRYQYSNHLGSATLELDEDGAVISYEEYYPYGSTSFQSGRSSAEVSLKRYRYTGKERDEETGMYYHGARYYIPWLVRWSAVDPLQGEMPQWSSYNYGYCNPIKWTDSTGMQPDEKN